MGRPCFEPRGIPLAVPRQAATYEARIEPEPVAFQALSLGNPHAVLSVDSVASADVASLGPAVQALPLFPEGVNVGFRQHVDRGQIRLRVYERGVGETLACGSGACAAVVAGIAAGELDREVRVELPGGLLWVRWDSPDGEVELTGPAEHVFDGEIEL